MKEFTLEGIRDLSDDFKTAFTTERVDLSSALICQIKNTVRKNGTGGSVFCISLLITPARTGKQYRKTIPVTESAVPELIRAGCFFQTGKTRYIPTEDAKCHCLYDYFGITSETPLNRFSPREDVLSLASGFRKTGYLGFIAGMEMHGFRNLVGMKAESGCNQDHSMMNILAYLSGKGDARFWSDYTEQERPDVNFRVFCRTGEAKTVDGTPVYILIDDNVTARKSMQISIAAELDGRMIRLCSLPVNHRLLTNEKTLAEKAMEMLHQYETVTLNTGATDSCVTGTLLPFVPKKGRAKFKSCISGSGKIPVLAAYDAMETGIFNILEKEHKTLCYDGGKARYEAALGKLLAG